MGTVSVDTFFMISGCLVAYLMFKELNKSEGRINFVMLYIHRYLRFVDNKTLPNECSLVHMLSQGGFIFLKSSESSSRHTNRGYAVESMK